MTRRADFFPPAASVVGTTRSRPRGLGLRRKPDTSGWGSPPPSQHDLHGIFQFCGNITNPNSICTGSPIRTIWKNKRKGVWR